MFDKVPKFRLILYILLLGMCLILFAGFYINHTLDPLDRLKEEIENIAVNGAKKQRQQKDNQAVMVAFENVDRFYIDKELETLPLLTKEIEAIRQALENKRNAPNEVLQKRLETVTSATNHLVFSEGVVQKYPFFQEVTETLVHPVEVDATDVQHILAIIEGREIGPFSPKAGRPQLLILDFRLERKSILQKNEIFLLNMKLLKREF